MRASRSLSPSMPIQAGPLPVGWPLSIPWLIRRRAPPRCASICPTSAVLDSGARQFVLIEKGEGRYEPRPVRLGLRGDDYVQVLDGVAVGEKVVVSANFLIDAESNLKAALGSFGGHGDHGG